MRVCFPQIPVDALLHDALRNLGVWLVAHLFKTSCTLAHQLVPLYTWLRKHIYATLI
jgi:hypothetical protein